LDLDLFKPQGLTGSEHEFERIGYFERVLSGNTRDRFGKIYSLVSKQTLIKWEIDVNDPEQYDRPSTNQTLFAEWIFEDKELSDEELLLPIEEQRAQTEKLVKGSESAKEFEKLLLFELGKLIWKDHRQVYYAHIEYLQQNICKLFKWTMVQYISRIREMYDYCIYLQPPSMKGQDFTKANWAKRDGIPPEEEIRKSFKDGLPELMQHKLAEEQFNDTLTTIEINDERERAAFKVEQDEVKSVQADLRETSEPRSGINANKRRKPSNNTYGRGTARYCTLCKNAGMPERKYMSHSSDANCQDKEEMARRAMSGCMADQNKQVRSTGKSRRLS
jgi:hypothetical protein